MSIEHSQPFDPDQAHNEALRESLENGGSSSFLARLRTGDEQISDTKELSHTKKARHPHPSGHATAEISGADVSRQLANQDAIEHPMPPEERRATTRRGVALAREALGKVLDPYQQIVDEVNAMIPIDRDNVAKSKADRERQINARIRTLHDRQHSA